MGLHWDPDKVRSDAYSDAYYENMWAAERSAAQRKEMAIRLDQMIVAGEVETIMGLDDLKHKIATSSGGYQCYATARVYFSLLTEAESLPVDDESIDSAIFVHDNVVYKKTNLPDGVLGIGAQHRSYNRVDITSWAIVARGLIEKTCLLHSEERRRSEAMANKRNLEAKLEAEKRDRLVANGYTIVTHQFRSIGRKTRGQIIPFVLTSDGETPSYVFEPTSIPAGEEIDFVVLALKLPNYGESIEIAFASHLDKMYPSDYFFYLEGQVEKAEQSRKDAEEAATKASNSPFAALAALKKTK